MSVTSFRIAPYFRTLSKTKKIASNATKRGEGKAGRLAPFGKCPKKGVIVYRRLP